MANKKDLPARDELNVSPGVQVDARVMDGLRTGDVLLFNRKCLAMKDPLSVGLCLLAKTNSSFDHVAVVYRSQPNNTVDHLSSLGPSGTNEIASVPHLSGSPSLSGTYVLEANVGGVTLRSLEERLRRTSSNSIAVRPLHLADEKDHQRVQSVFDKQVPRLVGVPYKQDLKEFMSSSLKPPDKLDRMTAAVKMRVLFNEITLIRDALARNGSAGLTPQSTSTALFTEAQSRLLQKLDDDYCWARQWLMTTYFPQLPKTFIGPKLMIADFDSQNLFFVDGKNLAIEDAGSCGVFCSELVVYLWQRAGIVKRFPPATSFSPVDFDQYDDEFNFAEETTFMERHQLLFPEHSRVNRIERTHAGDNVIAQRQRLPPLGAICTSSDTEAFVQQRMEVLKNLYRQCGVPFTLSTGSIDDVLSVRSVLPMKWNVQSTTHYQLVREMPERIVTCGALFSLCGFLTSPLLMLIYERQLGVKWHGSAWSLGAVLAGRSLMACLVQSWLTRALLNRSMRADENRSLTDIMRHSELPRTHLVDDRHPFYTEAALLIGCGAVAGALTHPLEVYAMFRHFGPRRPAPLSMKELWRGAPMSALLFTWSYGGGWLIWYECFGPLLYTTETSAFRHRPGRVTDDRWTTQQRDAMASAMFVTLAVETALYPLRVSWQRRQWRSWFPMDQPPAAHVAPKSLWVGLGRSLARSCGICAATGIAVWTFLL